MKSKIFTWLTIVCAAISFASCNDNGTPNVKDVDLFQDLLLIQINDNYYAGANFLALDGNNKVKLELNDGSSITANNIPMTYDPNRLGSITEDYVAKIDSEDCTFILKRPKRTCVTSASLKSLIALQPAYEEGETQLTLTQGETKYLTFRNAASDPDDPNDTVTQDPYASLSVYLMNTNARIDLRSDIYSPYFKVEPRYTNDYKTVPPGSYTLYIDVYRQYPLEKDQQDGLAGGQIYTIRRTVVGNVTVK